MTDTCDRLGHCFPGGETLYDRHVADFHHMLVSGRLQLGTHGLKIGWCSRNRPHYTAAGSRRVIQAPTGSVGLLEKLHVPALVPLPQGSETLCSCRKFLGDLSAASRIAKQTDKGWMFPHTDCPALGSKTFRCNGYRCMIEVLTGAALPEWHADTGGTKDHTGRGKGLDVAHGICPGLAFHS